MWTLITPSISYVAYSYQHNQNFTFKIIKSGREINLIHGEIGKIFLCNTEKESRDTRKNSRNLGGEGSS